MKIAIIEDEEKYRADLFSLIKKYGTENNVEMDIVCFENGETFLDKYDGSFTMVFMDIELPGDNGMNIVKKLRLIDEKVLVMFVTNLAQYAVNGYEVRAFDFIIKPVNYYSLAMKLNRAIECTNNNVSKHIWISSRQGKKMVDASKIKYVEIFGHSLTFHLDKEEIKTTGTLKKIKEELSGLPFYQCNQCFLVNLQYVNEINGGYVYCGKDKLTISAPKRKTFLNAFNNYLGAGGETK